MPKKISRIILREYYTYAVGLSKKLVLPQTKFIILSQGRTGSSLLQSLLDSHPQILCEGELLMYPVSFPNLYIKSMAARQYQKEVAWGFKVKPYHLTGTQKRDLNKFICDFYAEGWKIIRLERKDIFRQTISGIIGKYRNTWVITSENSKLNKTKIKIDTDQVIEWMEGKLKQKKWENEALDGLHYLNISYEDDLDDSENHQTTCDRICNHLKLPEKTIQTKLKKTTSRDLREEIENYDEVIERLKDTEYAQFLPNL